MEKNLHGVKRNCQKVRFWPVFMDEMAKNSPSLARAMELGYLDWNRVGGMAYFIAIH